MAEVATVPAKHTKRVYDKAFIANALNVVTAHNGNVLGAAKELGIPRLTLREWVINNRRVDNEVQAIQREKLPEMASLYEDTARLYLDHARNPAVIECKRGFGHAAEPWKSWLLLAQIETRSGNPAAAAEAKRKAIDSYVAYRREGGESHVREAHVGVAVTKFLLSGDKASAKALLHQVASESNLPRPAATFVRVLQAIVAGSRDRTLADNPDLGFHTRTEILVLIETLESVQ